MTTQTRRLTKDTQNGMAGGVCAGLANYFDIDPILVRAVFVAGAVLSGFSLVLYAVLWLALDEATPPELDDTADTDAGIDTDIDIGIDTDPVIELDPVLELDQPTDQDQPQDAVDEADGLARP